MTLVELPIDGEVIERFWANVDTSGGCWGWRGATDEFGYGTIGGRRGTYARRAHRLSYELHVGQHPGDLVVCHRCDNPPCVRPSHLFLGTRKDNNDDRHHKGRDAKQYGADHPRAKLTAEQVVQIRVSGDDALTLAVRYGVSRSAIYRARKGAKGWVHLTNAEALAAAAQARAITNSQYEVGA